MKKDVLTLCLLLCLLSASMLKWYKMCAKANFVQTWTVDDDGTADFKTIQEAINNASSGDIIFVRNGTYYENVVINKSIALIGEQRDFTIINGSEISSVVTIEADNVKVQGFTIMKSGKVFPHSGIFIKSLCMGNVITDNRIIENYYGIYVAFSSNVISGNIVSNNTYDGICFFNSFNNFVSDNFVSFNYLAGISLYNSGGNLIYDNMISENMFYGISLYSSSDNVLSTNTIVNHPYGISLAFSNNNTIFHNNFNNEDPVWSGDSINVWSYNGEGNYWSDYSGEDLNMDGIGDIPYIIDGTNNDTNPLMGKFFLFDVVHGGETHEVTIISNSTISNFQFQIGAETGNKIIHFQPSDNESVVGFCRLMIPTGFMSYPYIVLLGNEEISPTFLDISNKTHVYLYFTYSHNDQTVTIISSELYSELLRLYYDLNITLYNVLSNYSRLQEDFYQLNETYYSLMNIYDNLQEDFHDLNVTYYGLSDLLALLLSNYTQLQKSYQELNASYQDHLHSYYENITNVQNLTYILAAMTAFLIILTVYLSKRAHGGVTSKIKKFEEE